MAYAYLAEVPVRSSGDSGVGWRRVGGRLRDGIEREGGGGGYGACGIRRRGGLARRRGARVVRGGLGIYGILEGGRGRIGGVVFDMVLLRRTPRCL